LNVQVGGYHATLRIMLKADLAYFVRWCPIDRQSGIVFPLGQCCVFVQPCLTFIQVHHSAMRVIPSVNSCLPCDHRSGVTRVSCF